MPPSAQPLQVSLLAFPDAVVSTLSGLYDVMNSFRMLAGARGMPSAPPFDVRIVGAARRPLTLASGLPVTPDTTLADAAASDIVIVPSVLLGEAGWQRGRYPRLVEWLAQVHARGALLCSACSGAFLIAETGLLDGREATVHWPYAAAFRAAHPEVTLYPERVLVVAGERDELVSSGASMSWHDLVLYLIARHVGPTAAQTVARFFALQWHVDGIAPFMVFDPPTDHGDAAVLAAQRWLAENAATAAPVEAAARRVGLPERTFGRRFLEATGYRPLAYVQRLRVEEAKRRLERGRTPVDEIAWQVGYEDPSAFRRLFKRVTGIPPGRYRRQFSIPDYAAPAAAAKAEAHAGAGRAPGR